MEIQFKKGDGVLRTYRHIRQNLDDEHLKATPGVVKYLNARGDKIAAMTKAASYLLSFESFATIRDYLLAHAVWMVSDATGIAPKWGKPANFEYETYGTFAGAHLDIGKSIQNNWRTEFEAEPKRDLPFRFGYYDRNNKNHLIIIKKKTSWARTHLHASCTSMVRMAVASPALRRRGEPALGPRGHRRGRRRGRDVAPPLLGRARHPARAGRRVSAPRGAADARDAVDRGRGRRVRARVARHGGVELGRDRTAAARIVGDDGVDRGRVGLRGARPRSRTRSCRRGRSAATSLRRRFIPTRASAVDELYPSLRAFTVTALFQQGACPARRRGSSASRASLTSIRVLTGGQATAGSISTARAGGRSSR